jgi:hypothetical protein
VKRILNSRRSVVALAGILALTVLGLVNKVDVSLSVAACVAAVCGAGGLQGLARKEALSEPETKS